LIADLLLANRFLLKNAENTLNKKSNTEREGMSKEKSRHAEPLLRDPPGRRGEGGALRTTRPVLLPYGTAAAILRGRVVQSVVWERTREELEAVLAETSPGAEEVEPGECSAGRLLQAYSEGRRIPTWAVAAIPLEWALASGFQRRVWKETSKVPYGKTVTYGELAARCGSRKAARAVGAALSKNPWPVIVPCHRVVGAGGRMVGFGKGIAAKRILLAFEEKCLGEAAGCIIKRQNE
jgi:methylated-DNA-[protein]-cysteine S-methyltransferase